MKKLASVLQDSFFKKQLKIPEQVLNMIKSAGKNHGVPVTHEFATTVHRLYLYSIAKTLSERGRVCVPNLGVFRIKNRKPQRCFNIFTKKIQIVPGRKMVSFRQSNTLSQETVDSWKWKPRIKEPK